VAFLRGEGSEMTDMLAGAVVGAFLIGGWIGARRLWAILTDDGRGWDGRGE
jgi:hypothetical protein